MRLSVGGSDDPDEPRGRRFSLPSNFFKKDGVEDQTPNENGLAGTSSGFLTGLGADMKKSMGSAMSSISSAVSGGQDSAGKQRRSSTSGSIFGSGGAIDIANRRKQMQLSHILTLLDNLRLQCPNSNAGLALAYTTATMSPINMDYGSTLAPPPSRVGMPTDAPIAPAGIKFTWYRTGGHGSHQFTQVQESYRALYSPTADDIGHRLCLQVQDTFDEGYSRYIESEPILADPLLVGAAEMAIKSEQYATEGVVISLGDSDDTNIIDNVGQTADRDDNGSPLKRTNAEVGLEALSVLLQEQTCSALDSSSGHAFVELKETGVVCVDKEGVFIGTGMGPVRDLATPAPTLKAGGGDEGVHGEPMTPVSGEDNETGGRGRTKIRGFRIPVTPGLIVRCTQPRSLVITIPLSRKRVPLNAPLTAEEKEEEEAARAAQVRRDKSANNLEMLEGLEDLGSSPTSTSRSSTSNTSIEDGEKQFGSADTQGEEAETSILQKPWLYETIVRDNESGAITKLREGPEGVSQSKGAIVSVKDGDEGTAVTDAVEEKISAAFSSTVCSLAELVSSLPDGCKDMKLCLVCKDRQERDTLALTIRALVCRQSAEDADSGVKTAVSSPDTHTTDGDEDGNNNNNNNNNKGNTFNFLHALPWIDPTTLERRDERVAAVSEATVEMGARLNFLEHENVALKRERVELTMRLLESGGYSLLPPGSPIKGTGTGKASAASLSDHLSTSESSDSNNNTDKEPASPAVSKDSSNSSDKSSDLMSSKDETKQEAIATTTPQRRASSRGMEELAAIRSKNSNSAMNANVSELYAQLVLQKSAQDKLMAEHLEIEKHNRDLESSLKLNGAKLATVNKNVDRLKKENSAQQTSISTKDSEISELRQWLSQEKDISAEAVKTEKKIKSQLKEGEAVVANANDKVTLAQASLQKKETELSANEGKFKSLQTTSADQAATISQLEHQLLTTLSGKASQAEEIARISALLKEQEEKAAECDAAKADTVAAKESANKYQSQVNHEKKRADGVSKELKKVMKDNALAMGEFEKALLRKSEECNMLYEKVNASSGAGSGGVVGTGSGDAKTDDSTNSLSSVADSMKRFTSGLSFSTTEK